ncbi:peroxide stress protein YaaA [Undibacterium sp. SXout11W]|uniref:peroxide stress protein YaaA n=1 Tax=Undibacterium sp. SXout11W TaxID=3413050 RepID=UPI003BF433F3
MLIVLSPAKSLDFETPVNSTIFTKADFLDEAAELIEIAKQLSQEQLSSLMDISPNLAQLNAARFKAWKKKPVGKDLRQAIFAFNGDVYDGLNARSLNAEQLAYLQTNLRILSGLYGMLRPLDVFQAYRLEMGTTLTNPYGKNLYAFWGAKITDGLNALSMRNGSNILLNLASDEYFKVVKPVLFNGTIITPVFQDWKNGKYKTISFYAKRARGLMARYCAEHSILDVEDIKNFDADQYAYCEEESTSKSWVFRRRVELN